MTPTTFAPGATLTVSWLETIDHPGNYRIAFSPAGDLGFDDNILLDNIPDLNGPVPAGGRPYSSEITLPMTECTDCTLQLIQVMTETVPPSLYFSCTDLVISALAPDAGPPGPDAGPGGPDGGTPGSDAGDPTGEDVGDPPGLCAVGVSRSASVWSALLLLAVAVGLRVAFRRRT